MYIYDLQIVIFIFFVDCPMFAETEYVYMHIGFQGYCNKFA